MDLGVGSFVFSGGVVSSRQPNTSAGRQIWNAFRSSFVILLMGVIRMVLTKKVDYQVYLGMKRANEGTCYGVWSSLEFLYYIGIVTSFRDIVSLDFAK